MPWDDPDPADPMTLVGSVVACEDGRAAHREMACVFAEEFARMGFSGERILDLFRSPFYAAAHGAARALGEAEIREIVEESVAAWGRVRVVAREANPPLLRIEPDTEGGTP